MKLLTVFCMLTATASAISYPTCKNPTALCKYVSQQNAGRCNGLIDNKGLKITTCQAVAPTVTLTRTIQPTAFVTRTVYPPEFTKKVQKTVTKAGQPVVEPTRTVTATLIQFTKTTVIDTTVCTTTSTEVTTEMETTITTSTSTELTTSTVPWDKPWCGIKKRCVDLRDIKKAHDRRAPLPQECSCFLSSTQAPKSTQTATVTVKNSPCTETAYVENNQTPTLTRTITFTKYSGGRTLCAPEATETITKVFTRTIHSLTTVFDTTITTLTQHDTTTITETTVTTEVVMETAVDPCDDLAESQDNGLIYPMDRVAESVVASETSSDVSVNECCRSCYSSPSCAFFRHRIEPDGECTKYLISDDASNLYCQGLSDLCPVGFVEYPWRGEYADPDYDYWYGPCLGFAGQQR